MKVNTVGKYKYLIKNMGLLTISNFATKLLSFFLVPLYTSVLTTAEYGTYDLFHTTINLLIPILTVDIQEGVLRYAMDDNAEHGDIFTIGFKYVIGSFGVVAIVTLVNEIFSISPTLKEYAFEFILLYLFNSLSSFLAYYVRGTARIKEISIAGVISSVVVIVANLLFLLVLKWGLNGYFYAYILGGAAQSLYLFFTGDCLQELKKRHQNKKIEKDIVDYSKPMVANAVSWWINNASDRYVVTWLCGIAVNGIYSVSYKIPTILSVLQSIFGQAWTLSAVKEFDPEDDSGFFINIYNMFNLFLVMSCSILILFDKVIARILFANDFFEAWKYAPFLLISTVFSGLAAFIGGLLSAMKKSRSFAKTSVITAIINTVLNIVLVYLMDAQGAAISTAVAYFLMWILRLLEVKKVMKLRINLKRDLIVYLLLVIQSIVIIYVDTNISFDFIGIIFLLGILSLYCKEIQMLLSRIKNLANRHNKKAG